jgi:VanZ family protein
MLPLRYARTWLVAGLVLLAVGLVLAILPASSVMPVSVSDKFVHAATFLVLMLWFGGIFEARVAPFLVVTLSVYGLLIEMLQSLTPTRQADFMDLLADVAGVMLGWVLSGAGLSRWCVTLESWFTPRNP